MGRGSSKAGGGGTGGVNPNNIVDEEDMISARNPQNQREIDAVLNVARKMTQQYGNDVAVTGSFTLAKFKGKDSNTLGCYSHGDGSITLNKKYVGNKDLNKAYDRDVKAGFHPSRGRKSGVEAVAAHEYGHSLTANVQQKMGEKTFNGAASRIVTEARKSTGTKGTNRQFRKSISGYGSGSDVEAVAEAVADVYCNGGKAGKASKAIVKVMNGYLKKKK